MAKTADGFTWVDVPATGASKGSTVPTLQDILTIDPDDFVRQFRDVAAINLACASGLPHAGDLDIPKQIAALNAMAKWVGRRLAGAPMMYRNAVAAGKFKGSEAAFCVTLVLRQLHFDYGIEYNPARNGGRDHDPTDAGDQFIHGILSKRRTGMCASLPVFAVAIGRRLGMPLYLVKVPEHLIFRWEDAADRINFEYGGHGCEIHDDEFYRNWPVKWNGTLRHQEQHHGAWLRSLTPKQEVALCLETRAFALLYTNRFDEALVCVNAAERFNPGMPHWPQMRAAALSRTTEPSSRQFAVRTGPSTYVLPTPTMPTMESDTLRWQTSPFDHLPMEVEVGRGLACCANFWWNFVKNPSPVPTIHPSAQQLRDALDPFRDRTQDAKGLNVILRGCWTKEDEPLWVHNIKFRIQNQGD